MARVTTPFGRDSTAAEVVEGVDLGGRRAVVTGAASGIGVETARALAGAGADVTLAVRDVDAGRRVADGIVGTTSVAHVDLSSRATIAAFAEGWEGPLHILVNNAGIMATPETRTPEGWESQLATNHLGHLALTVGLHGPLAAAGGARVVNLSSVGHRRSPVVFDDLMFDERPYDPWAAYGQSKTANVLTAVAIASRWAGDGVTANACHPGGIMTNLQRHMDPADIRARGWVDEEGRPNPRFKTPEQGAATSTLLAASPLVEGVTGRYFEDCNEALPASADAPMSGVEPYALDPEAADRLWHVSLALLRR
jgi:NAD(P)-dependent dehydrogenase (short-subunit alcohol dehydrogenase family)